MPEPILRTTARVVPVSPGGACLLLLECDPARPGEPPPCHHHVAGDGRLMWPDLPEVLATAVASVEGRP